MYRSISLKRLLGRARGAGVSTGDGQAIVVSGSADAGPGWRLRMFGACDLIAPDGTSVQLPQRKALALLVYVERQPERRAVRERLAALLWDHADSAQARLNLRKALPSIRQCTAGEHPLTILTAGDTVAIDASGLSSDVSEFEAILRDRPVPLERLRAAAALYRGEFLSDFAVRNASEFDHWMLIERQRLREMAINVLCQLMDHEDEQPDARASAALRLLALDPLQEAAHRTLMRQLVRQGRHSAALKQYHGLADLLARELGSQPEPATQQLFREIAQGRQNRAEAPVEQTVSVETTQEQQSAPLAVEEVAQTAAAVPEVQPGSAHAVLRPRGRKGPAVIAGGVALALAGVLAGAFLLNSGADAPPRKAEQAGLVKTSASIAVLPFSTFGAGGEIGHFADGLTEEVINSLVQGSSLHVTGRTSSFHFKDQNLDLREIGRRLGVAYIVEGSVRRTGNRLRVTAQLVNVENGFHVWSETYDRTLDDIFAIQESIAEAVANELEARLAVVPSQQQLRFSPENYRTYLLARSYLRSTRRDDLEAARTLFDRLRSAEPNNAYVHAGYVMAAIKPELSWGSTGFDRTLGEIEKSARRALEIAPHLSEAHLAQGLLMQFQAMSGWQQDKLEASEAALRHAVQLGPRNASALMAYGHTLLYLGRHEEAAGYLKRAIQLDPLAAEPKMYLAEAFEGQGQADLAIDQYRELLKDHPELAEAKFGIGRLKVRLGRLDEAEAWLRAAFEKSQDPIHGYWLLATYTNLGLTEEATRQLNILKTVDTGRKSAQAVEHIRARRYQALLAHSEAELAATHDPTWAYIKFFALALPGNVDEARAFLAETWPELLGDKPTVHPVTIDHAGIAAHVLGAAGETEQSRRVLRAVVAATDQPGSVKSVQRLIWRVGALAKLGEHDRALKELRQIIDQGFRTPVDTVVYLHVDDNPLFDSLRGDREFQSLMAEVDRDLRRMRANVTRDLAARKTNGVQGAPTPAKM